MSESIFLIGFAIILIPLGIMNIKGNISSIHWYNRRKVSEEDASKYGRLMGISSLIISAGFAVTGLGQCIAGGELWALASGIACIIAFAIMLYAQLKYNKGIF